MHLASPNLFRRRILRPQDVLQHPLQGSFEPNELGVLLLLSGNSFFSNPYTNCPACYTDVPLLPLLLLGPCRKPLPSSNTSRYR
jgi:hypothetical protein